MNVHFSSATDQWSTPPDFFAKVAERFNFALDVCADAANAKCPSYFTEAQDGLAQRWDIRGDVWMNPPYGRQIGKWVQKAYSTSLLGTTVVCLVPARTDTKWFQDYCLKGEVEFIRGRLKFGDAKHNAPFPCALVIFRGQK